MLTAIICQLGRFVRRGIPLLISQDHQHVRATGHKPTLTARARALIIQIG
jgi:hypothetical protein